MMSVNPVTRLALWGGLLGLVLPLSLSPFFLLAASRVAMGEHFVAALPVFALALLELPIVWIGRACGLPIEAVDSAFIPFNLNGLGYTLMLVFWIFVGLLVGGGIGISKHFPRRC